MLPLLLLLGPVLLLLLFFVVVLLGLAMLAVGGALLWWLINPAVDSAQRPGPSTQTTPPTKASWTDGSTNWEHISAERPGLVKRAIETPTDANAVGVVDAGIGSGIRYDSGGSSEDSSEAGATALLTLVGSIPFRLLGFPLAGMALASLVGSADASTATESHSETMESVSKSSRKRLRRMQRQDGRDDTPVETGMTYLEDSDEDLGWATRDGKDW